jgi:ABC-2 type transport system ATP-binding protein
MLSEYAATVAKWSVTRGGIGAVTVSVENVSKVYPRRRWLGLRCSAAEARYALKNVSLTVRRGEMVGLLGPNGAGKTTLLKSIATLLSVSSGRILVLGRDVAADAIAARRAIGLITCDERSFYWRLTGRQNLRFFAALYGVPEEHAAGRIHRLLDMLGLSRAGDLPYRGYSSGMRQKLSIARGLLSEPSLILYDEPTRSLDPLSAQGIRAWIIANRLASPDTTHVIATNQLHEAEQLCDRVAILNHGTIIADGSIGRIRERYCGGSRVEHRLTFFGASGLNLRPSAEIGLFEIRHDPSEGELTTVRITTSETGEGLSAVLSHILNHNGSVVRCETGQVSFDEVFCSLVTGNHVSEEER